MTNILGKKVFRKNFDVSSRPIVSAWTFVKVTAEKNFIKTSIAVNT